jgi:hypothetical protein
MELSKMFGVERDTDFGVEGYESFMFNINTTINGMDRLYFKHNDGCWIFAKSEMLTDIIYGAPGNIIHLPPPLTDEQREQLKAIWTLGGRWLAKDADRDVYAYSVKPEQDSDWAEWVPIKYDEDELQFTVYRDLDVCDLVSWSDPEPYDIGKALGVTE